MTTINLQQHMPGAEQKSSSLKLTSGGLIYSLGIFILVIILLVSLKAYNTWLSARNMNLENQIAEKNKDFSAQDVVDQVVDVQSRVSWINKDIREKVFMTEIMRNLAADIVSGVSATSYKYDGQKISVSLSANNFTDVSRQILNFKKSKNFTGVTLSGMNRGEKNLTFDVTMSISPATAVSATAQVNNETN